MEAKDVALLVAVFSVAGLGPAALAAILGAVWVWPWIALVIAGTWLLGRLVSSDWWERL